MPVELNSWERSFLRTIAIGKIEDVFTRQVNFSADIAHEIRRLSPTSGDANGNRVSQNRSQKELEDVLYPAPEEYNR